jgi:hypothetical protein
VASDSSGVWWSDLACRCSLRRRRGILTGCTWPN